MRVMLWGGEEECEGSAVSVEAKDFVRRLCERDVDRRPDADEALRHVWVSRGTRDRVMSDVRMDEVLDGMSGLTDDDGNTGGMNVSSTTGGLRYYLRRRANYSGGGSGSFVS